MAAMLDGSGGAAQAGWATRPARTTTSASTMMRATRPIASPSCPEPWRPASQACWPSWTGGCHGTVSWHRRLLPGHWLDRLATPATLVPPAGRVLVVDVDPLLADLLGHPLLAGHSLLVEPHPLSGHDPLLHHRLLLPQDHLVLLL